MAHTAFSRPLVIEEIVIADVNQAAEYLVEDWPIDHGDRYEFARRVCLEVIEGKRDPEDARQAFILAAGEAGITITT
ncbi:DUF982 domain-containing protein [Labrys sp. KNU-23]|uniref:DUF982 domain-containing protein n=1 Tax=unclassified Labrys (in: a-proteobacteria) TaxID=2688601 RepID=UPI0011F015A4|nr:DUF982 domain-containing protein [Labrys sp. KNU-23]QEN84838.1 DUF982 domain-containing protein [Labrys sp. KNU-23]